MVGEYPMVPRMTARPRPSFVTGAADFYPYNQDTAFAVHIKRSPVLAKKRVVKRRRRKKA